MRMRILAAAAAAAFAMAGIAAACEGQEGSVIFEDNFADDSGGWELSPMFRFPEMSRGPSRLVFCVR